jgi:hypothetical protein
MQSPIVLDDRLPNRTAKQVPECISMWNLILLHAVAVLAVLCLGTGCTNGQGAAGGDGQINASSPRVPSAVEGQIRAKLFAPTSAKFNHGSARWSKKEGPNGLTAYLITGSVSATDRTGELHHETYFCYVNASQAFEVDVLPSVVLKSGPTVVVDFFSPPVKGERELSSRIKR